MKKKKTLTNSAIKNSKFAENVFSFFSFLWNGKLLQNPIPPNLTASRARRKFSSPCGFTERFRLGGAGVAVVVALVTLFVELAPASLFEF